MRIVSDHGTDVVMDKKEDGHEICICVDGYTDHNTAMSKELNVLGSIYGHERVQTSEWGEGH